MTLKGRKWQLPGRCCWQNRHRGNADGAAAAAAAGDAANDRAADGRHGDSIGHGGGGGGNGNRQPAAAPLQQWPLPTDVPYQHVKPTMRPVLEETDAAQLPPMPDFGR